MKDNRHIYLSKRSLIKDDYNRGILFEKYKNLVNQFDIAVVIPVKNEYPSFFQTLDSLNDSWAYAELKCGKKILVISVVNALENDNPAVIENNGKLLETLEDAKTQKKYAGLDFFTIDLNPPNGFLPEKQGVGYARKIGMDYAIFFDCKIHF